MAVRWTGVRDWGVRVAECGSLFTSARVGHEVAVASGWRDAGWPGRPSVGLDRVRGRSSGTGPPSVPSPSVDARRLIMIEIHLFSQRNSAGGEIDSFDRRNRVGRIACRGGFPAGDSTAEPAGQCARATRKCCLAPLKSVSGLDPSPAGPPARSARPTGCGDQIGDVATIRVIGAGPRSGCRRAARGPHACCVGRQPGGNGSVAACRPGARAVGRVGRGRVRAARGGESRSARRPPRSGPGARRPAGSRRSDSRRRRRRSGASDS